MNLIVERYYPWIITIIVILLVYLFNINIPINHRQTLEFVAISLGFGYNLSLGLEKDSLTYKKLRIVKELGYRDILLSYYYQAVIVAIAYSCLGIILLWFKDNSIVKAYFSIAWLGGTCLAFLLYLRFMLIMERLIKF